MIDIKFLRENPDIVKENIKKKFQDHKLELVDKIIELDAKSRAVNSRLTSSAQTAIRFQSKSARLWLRAKGKRAWLSRMR